jgi:hypothetical protein
VPVLEALVTEPDDDVQVAVARSIGALREESFLPVLLEQLRREAVRPVARRAFREFGPAGLEFLEAALADTTLPQEVRRHIPRAIAGFPARDAVAVLQRHLLQEQDGMVRFRILRALGRVATRHPGVSLDDALLAAAAGRTVGALCRLEHWRDVLERGGAVEPRRITPGHQMLAALLRDKVENAEERLFRLLDLLYRREDFHRIYRGLRSADRRVEASSRELLENVVRPPLKAAVLALVDDASGPARRESTAAFYEREPLDYESLITTFIEQPGETLRSLAVFHVGELGLQGLQGRIAELRSQETSLFVGQMFDRTLRLLGGAEEGSAAS